MEWQPDQWQSRAQFFGVSATLMRRILVQFARERQSQKRGGDVLRVSLSEAAGVAAPPEGTDLVALDAALDQREKLDPRQARVTIPILTIANSDIVAGWQSRNDWMRRR